MRTDIVVMGHPVLNHDPGFQTVAEPIDRQALIAELPVEALGGVVLQWLARVPPPASG
jgi:hypothetical protein